MKKILSVVFLILLTSCSGNDLPIYSHLDSLRVLALIADQPEVAPGASVNITPYISDATGAGRALKYSAVACPDPGISLGATPSCTGSTQAVTLAASQALTLPTLAHSYTGAANVISVAVPANLLIGQGTINTYNGVSYLVTYELSASDGTSTSAFKRIIVSQGHGLNSNPSISDVLLSGVSFAAMPTLASSLLPSIPAAAAEAFNYLDSSATLVAASENLLLTWFTNAGDFQYIRTDSISANQFTPGKSPPVTGHNTFVFVLRDGRGGEAILQKDF